jgi:hypothetical protein
MVNRRVFIIAAICFAFGILAAWTIPSHAEDGEKTPMLKLGMVDLGAIVDGYSRRTDLEESLKIAMQAEQAKLQSIQNMIKSTTEAIELKEREAVDENDEGYISLKNNLEILRLQAKQQANDMRRKLDLGKARILQTIYADFTKYVAKYAQVNEFDLIMADNKVTDLQKENSYENLIMKISMQPVYYYREGANVTQSYLAFMNAEYAKDKGPAAAPVGPVKD